MHKCENCGTEFESAFCPNCGTAAEEKQSEAIQREIEQFGINETWKKYRPSDNQRIKIARTVKFFLDLLEFTFLFLTVLSIMIWNTQQGLTAFLLVLALVTVGAKFPAEFYGNGYITRRKQIKFIQEKSINLKRLLLNGDENVKKENTEIAYYTANNKEKGLLKSDIVVSVVDAVLSVALIVCVGIFPHELMSMISNIASILILLVLIIFVVVIVAVCVQKHRKNASPKIEKWAEEYLSKN